MAARIRIHPLLADLVHNQDLVEVSGSTVGECLADLGRKFPGVSSYLFDSQAKLLREIEILINGTQVGENELAHPVREGDEVSLLMLLSGG